MESQRIEDRLKHYVKEHFYAEYLDGLKKFVQIESLAPLFDEKWQENRNLFKQMTHLREFAQAQNVKGIQIKEIEDQGRSPFLIVDVEASAGNTGKPAPKEQVLMYGHMDKQPYGEGWDTHPCDPVIKDDRLYGRGSSDDGYAFFTAVLTIKACQDLGLSHPRCTITIEGSEEGEIADLIHYMQKYKGDLGKPDLIFCLDAGATTEETLTVTNSLRGCLNFDLVASVGTNNCHSGVGGGIIPNPFQILTNLLQRIQDFKTQDVHQEFQVEIPQFSLEQCHKLAREYPLLSEGLPMLPGVKHQACKHHGAPDSKENLELHLNNWWRPQLTVIGMEGLPTNLAMAGNAIMKEIKLRCSMRLAPTQKGEEVVKRLKQLLVEDQRDDTFGAKIKFEVVDVADGFCAPDFTEHIKNIVFESTREVFDGKDPIFVGCGGSIPFMEVMSREFPGVAFLLIGVGFNDSNAHSANENLRLGFCAKLATTLSLMLSKF